MNDFEKVIFDSAASPDDRLEALKAAKTAGTFDGENGEYVNNHIHTIYSFSPYTPSAALYMAKKAGLKTAGIMDHDSVGGASEFLAGGEILDMPVTVGCEMRVSVKDTALYGKRLNNPDQKSCAYVAMHGIPHQNLEKLEAVLSVKREARNKRNRRMCAAVNKLCAEMRICIDFDCDVAPLSQCSKGGSITERHVLFALVVKICEKFQSRAEQLSAIESLSGKAFSDSKKANLLSAPEEYYKYDLLGVLKSGLIEKIYIDADEELLNIRDFVALADSIGAVSAYAYLGDVGESPTGDKKAQSFEDSYIELLFEELSHLGFNAVTYMPSRNTDAQLKRVMELCDKYGFFQISGEDINSPRQSFVCPALERAEFSHLKRATYALIGHEMSATADIEDAMFRCELPLEEKIAKYAAVGGYKLNNK